MLRKDMTAITGRLQNNTILDFSRGKFSKNKIKKLLQNCEIKCFSPGSKLNEVIHHVNIVKVGMYNIRIILPYDSSNHSKLKDYDFIISIRDNKYIDLEHDIRFKNEYWIHKNCLGTLKSKHLIDAIAYCCRLNQLNYFL